MKQEEKKKEPGKSEATESGKGLRYKAPELVEYGSLESITMSGGSGSSDFLGMQTGMGMN